MCIYTLLLAPEISAVTFTALKSRVSLNELVNLNFFFRDIPQVAVISAQKGGIFFCSHNFR